MKTDYNKLKKEFLDYLKKERGFSDYTVQSYNIDIKIFFDFCRKLDVYFGPYLEKVKPLTIRNFLADEMAKIQSSRNGSKPLSEKTIARRLASVKALFRYLYNFEKILDCLLYTSPSPRD